MTSETKATILAQIDVAMGGHVAEKLLCGKDKITNGCGSDLKNATQQAYQAVRSSGMFGDLVSYNSSSFQNSSEEYNAKIDRAAKQILDVSKLSLISKIWFKHLNSRLNSILFFVNLVKTFFIFFLGII